MNRKMLSRLVFVGVALAVLAGCGGGIRFRIYRSGGVTLVFWQEGSVVCVLAADGDPEQAIQRAYAKAVKL